MLKSIDILIGLAVIMLVVSMAVTLITQAITSLLQSRGRHLLTGITDLFEQLHPGMTRERASCIAEMVLKHPSSAGHKDDTEFIKLLIEPARTSRTSNGPKSSPESSCSTGGAPAH